MKNIKIILVLILFCCYSNSLTSANQAINLEIEQQNDLAEQVYNRLVISSRIIEYTNKYIDSKRSEHPSVPNNTWELVKNSINYNNFKNNVLQILNNNLTSSQMQRLIDEFSQRPSIPIPTLKIKKEMYDLMPNFQTVVNSKISQVLSNNGF